jgi:hypothetical protein
MVEIQLTHGFCLFPSLRALTLVALSGGEFSSGIGDTTGGGTKEGDGIQGCLPRHLLATSLTQGQSM